MNIYLAFTLFGVIILIYWIITEVFTMLFRFTGLPEEKARFQVISLLTGCGFTTHESEIIVASGSRRRLARATMLFGYVFNVTIVSAFVNVFLSLKTAQMENFVVGMIAPLTLILILFLLMRVRTVRMWADHLIEALAGRILHQDTVNSCLLLDHIGGGSIAQITLRSVPDALRGKPLSESRLKQDHNIMVMLIEHPGQEICPPDASTVFTDGDKLTVFGKYHIICRVFEAAERFTDN